MELEAVLDMVFKAGMCAFAFATISRQSRLGRALQELQRELEECRGRRDAGEDRGEG